MLDIEWGRWSWWLQSAAEASVGRVPPAWAHLSPSHITTVIPQYSSDHICRHCRPAGRGYCRHCSSPPQQIWHRHWSDMICEELLLWGSDVIVSATLKLYFIVKLETLIWKWFLKLRYLLVHKFKKSEQGRTACKSCIKIQISWQLVGIIS